MTLTDPRIEYTRGSVGIRHPLLRRPIYGYHGQADAHVALIVLDAMRADGYVRSNADPDWARGVLAGSLFDHPFAFRRNGIPIVISQPYVGDGCNGIHRQIVEVPGLTTTIHRRAFWNPFDPWIMAIELTAHDLPKVRAWLRQRRSSS